MTQPGSARPGFRLPPDWVLWLIALFAAFWIFSLFTSLMASGCGSPSRAAEKRETLCALAAPGMRMLDGGRPHRRAGYLTNYALTLDALDRRDEALPMLDEAWTLAMGARPLRTPDRRIADSSAFRMLKTLSDRGDGLLGAWLERHPEEHDYIRELLTRSAAQEAEYARRRQERGAAQR